MKLKEIRQKKGLTQQELSIQSGLNIVTIQKIECGKNNLSGARFSTILALYRVLGSDVFIAANTDIGGSLASGMPGSKRERVLDKQ